MFLHTKCTVMMHLIPRPLLACLEHIQCPDLKFMIMSSSDIQQPLAIWNSGMQSRAP
jgi:hypothetical protein